MKPRIVVLGGTFDPVHVGHVSVLQQVAQLMRADRALLVPSSTPAHRPSARASSEQRLEMARAAVAELAGLDVDDSEVRRGGITYTMDSLIRWQAAARDVEFHLILGADAARQVAGWHRAAELLAGGHFVIVNRSGISRLRTAEAAELGFSPGRTRLQRVISPAVSATEIRRRVAAGESIAAMVPAAVEAMIKRDGLYRDAAAPVR